MKPYTNKNLPSALKGLPLSVLLAAVMPAISALAQPVQWPEGFTVPKTTVSPDGRFGVLAPDAGHYDGAEQDGNRLVELATGRELAVIRAATGLEHMNHGGIYPSRLEGSLQADATLAWGRFTLLRGKEARRARLDLDNARNHAGWPPF